jgi:hypothetical protein
MEHPHSTNCRQSKHIVMFYQKKSKSTITNNKRTSISNPNKTQIRILFMVFNISDTLLVLWCLLHVYLAARRCTFSSEFMFSFVWGSQTVQQYSNLGLIRVWYARSFIVCAKRNPIHFYYNMHGHILESVQHAKYLGVTISTDLKWNTHIQQTAAKANKSLCCLTSQTHCWCYDVCCMYTWLPVAVPFLASWCFRLCEDPKQCSSILIWVLSLKTGTNYPPT